MSHVEERKEKDCLNCGAIVEGRFCQQCGQENIVPHETFWHMFKHFFYDITHFDSKFFYSLKYLLFRPGFLSIQYTKGKRASYLHPVKMYVFTSAVFFLIFFSFFSTKSVVKSDLDEVLSPRAVKIELAKVEKKLEKDSTNVLLIEARELLNDTTQDITKRDLMKYWEDFHVIGMGVEKYKTVKEYDSLQKALPAAGRDGWFIKFLKRRAVGINEKYRLEPMNASEKLEEILLHKLPYMLFVSLPLFAFFLKLLYLRRKKFYYFDHGIFTIHLYIFSFILLLLILSLSELADKTGWDFLSFIIFLLFLSGGFYLYKAMRKFYAQGRFKTFLKFLLLNLFGIISLFLLFVIFIAFSIFEL